MACNTAVCIPYVPAGNVNVTQCSLYNSAFLGYSSGGFYYPESTTYLLNVTCVSQTDTSWSGSVEADGAIRVLPSINSTAAGVQGVIASGQPLTGFVQVYNDGQWGYVADTSFYIG